MFRRSGIPPLFAALTICALVLPPHLARAQSGAVRAVIDAIPTPIGKIVTVTGLVHVERTLPVIITVSLPGDGGIAPTRSGDSVYSGDVIQTGADGKAGIIFVDGTAFNISNNARIVLNEFIYDPNGRSNSALLTLTKGAFTFVAGKVAKTGKMEIDTPVATMGIRGTTPRVEFRDDGSVAFSTLIEENRAAAQQPGGAVRERTPATPVNERRAKGQADVSNIGHGITAAPNLRICRRC